MSLKERLKSQLIAARGFTDQMLSAFKTPEQWTHQVHPRANHALWFAGHMGCSDNFFVSVLDATKAMELPPGYNEKFGMGSQPSGNPADYPAVSDVLEFMRAQRKVLLEILDGMKEDDLATANPKGTPDFLKDKGAVFELAVWHEGIHTGQVSVAHRHLGNRPVMGGPPS